MNYKWSLKAYTKMQATFLTEITKTTVGGQHVIGREPYGDAWMIGDAYHIIAIPSVYWMLDAEQIATACTDVARVDIKQIWETAQKADNIALFADGTEKVLNNGKRVVVLKTTDGDETWIAKGYWDALKPLRAEKIDLIYYTNKAGRGAVSVWNSDADRVVAVLMPIANNH